ncbi:MAG: acyl carrier protein [Lachnospiraceae bacterium]|nr:acyl carrier protein [Lachnospiraceae bacterium]
MVSVEINEGCKNRNIEIVKIRSGKWYPLYQRDMAIFIAETKQILSQYICHGTKVGLFLDLDDAHFTSIVLYQACIASGAAVFRCGITDIERQWPIKNEIMLDILICTSSAFKYVESRLKYKNYILLDNIENIEGQRVAADELVIYDLFSIPGFIISYPQNIICPGYIIEFPDEYEKAILLSSKKEIEGFSVSDYRIDLFIDNIFRIEQLSEPARDYIKLQVEIVLKELLDGKIDCQENIALNSIGMIELLIKLEEEFGISIPIEKIDKSSFEKISLLSDLIYSTVMECDDVQNC